MFLKQSGVTLLAMGSIISISMVLSTDTTMEAKDTCQEKDKMVCVPGETEPVPDIGPLPEYENRPLTAEEKLGMLVFCHPKLSKSESPHPIDSPVGGRYGCASCHNPTAGFAEHRRQSVGANDKDMPGRRNAPAIYNARYRAAFFWDGHVQSLKEQVYLPVTKDDMDVDIPTFIKKIKNSKEPDYRAAFRSAYDKDIDTLGPDEAFSYIAGAIAAFESIIISTDSPFDKYMRAVQDAIAHGQSPPRAADLRISGFGDVEEKGMKLFKGEARCILCHNGATFTDNQPDIAEEDRFHNVGYPRDEDTKKWIRPELVADGKEKTGDAGRYRVTKNDHHLGMFLTPTLRNVAQTWPYMHDGGLPSLNTRTPPDPSDRKMGQDGLRQAVEFFITGGGSHDRLDPRMKPMKLKGSTSEEKKKFKNDVIEQLVAFLNSLSDDGTIAKLLKDEWLMKECPLTNPS